MNITKQLQAAIWVTVGVVLTILSLLAIPFGLVMLNVVVGVVALVGVGWLVYGLYVLWSRAIRAQKSSNAYRTGGSRY
jgi:hypothetical protein